MILAMGIIDCRENYFAYHHLLIFTLIHTLLPYFPLTLIANKSKKSCHTIHG
jgi:hypothetical protein